MRDPSTLLYEVRTPSIASSYHKVEKYDRANWNHPLIPLEHAIFAVLETTPTNTHYHIPSPEDQEVRGIVFQLLIYPTDNVMYRFDGMHFDVIEFFLFNSKPELVIYPRQLPQFLAFLRYSLIIPAAVHRPGWKAMRYWIASLSVCVIALVTSVPGGCQFIQWVDLIPHSISNQLPIEKSYFINIWWIS